VSAASGKISTDKRAAATNAAPVAVLRIPRSPPIYVATTTKVSVVISLCNAVKRIAG